MDTRPRDNFPQYLLSQGRFTFTTEEAEAILGSGRQAALAALARLQRRGAVFSPAKPSMSRFRRSTGVWERRRPNGSSTR